MDMKFWDKMKEKKPCGEGNRKQKKKLAARQKAFDSMQDTKGKTRPGSMNPKKG